MTTPLSPTPFDPARFAVMREALDTGDPDNSLSSGPDEGSASEHRAFCRHLLDRLLPSVPRFPSNTPPSPPHPAAKKALESIVSFGVAGRLGLVPAFSRLTGHHVLFLCMVFDQGPGSQNAVPCAVLLPKPGDAAFLANFNLPAPTTPTSPISAPPSRLLLPGDPGFSS